MVKNKYVTTNDNNSSRYNNSNNNDNARNSIVIKVLAITKATGKRMICFPSGD